MISNERKINDLFYYWLLISLILVFLIVIIGGLTRLTNSGLSITQWELFSGVLPPLNNHTWENYFHLYKQIPQYKLLNFNMSLNEFKIIFYWEYYHRMLARVIGLFFLIPLIYFYFSRKINKKYLKICYLICGLIFLQGIIGWYMVKSGLVNDVTVSHYRLAAHLFTAILIASLIFWLIKNISLGKNKIFFQISFSTLPTQILILLIYTQIILGAFVSGLDAGQIYQSWPKMGNNYFPNDFNFVNIKSLFNFNNHSLVQFYHRNLAYIVIIYSLVLFLFIYKNKIFYLLKPIKIFLFFLLAQIFLGIFTLISGLNIYLASLHQITSLLLVLSALNLYYFTAK